MPSCLSMEVRYMLSASLASFSNIYNDSRTVPLHSVRADARMNRMGYGIHIIIEKYCSLAIASTGKICHIVRHALNITVC